NSRPKYTVKARFIFNGGLYNPLSITALYGSEVMLLKILEISDCDSDYFLLNLALAAAE
ncbi:uncharacterized protein F5Z01DRAFT_625351, partial [Emericellopsis atlantica]